MKARVLGPDDFHRQPWKNGGGTTLELARQGDADGYEWRVSTALVTASGPFSTFPGYERTSVMLEGGPFALRFGSGGGRELAEPLQGCRFDGAEPVDGRLPPGADARLFNVLADPARWQANVVPLRPGGGSIRHVPAGQTLLVWVWQGDLDIDLNPPGEGWSLLSGEALLVEDLAGDTGVTLHDQGGEAVIVVVELARVGAG